MVRKDAQEAARFYIATFPDSQITDVHEASSDYPGGKKGDVVTMEFTVLGIHCLGLNGGPTFLHSQTFSFQIATEDQAEDETGTRSSVMAARKVPAVGARTAGGLFWQITPRVLMDAVATGGGESNTSAQERQHPR